jgi:hypothetical protein
MGIATTTSETAFTQSAQEVYDFVTNPGNWPKTYPSSRAVDAAQAVGVQLGRQARP